MSTRSGLLNCGFVFLSIGLVLTATSEECTNVLSMQSLYRDHAELWQAVQTSLEKSYFFPQPTAKRLCREMFRGLMCKSCVKEPLMLSLPPAVDLAWHQAILNTRLYREMCQAVFGELLEHTTTTMQDPLETKNRRIDATEGMYKSIFQKDPPKDLWKREVQKLDTSSRIRNRIEGFYTIFVKTRTNEPMLHYEVKGSYTVFQLKKILAEKTFPECQQRIIFDDRELSDEDTLSDCQVHDGDELSVLLRLRGC